MTSPVEHTQCEFDRPIAAKLYGTSDESELFVPMKWYDTFVHSLLQSNSRSRTIEEVRRAIPARLFKRDTTRGLLYLARDLAMAAIVWRLGMQIDTIPARGAVVRLAGHAGAEMLRWGLWLV